MSYLDDMAKATRTPMVTDREKVVSVRLSDEEYAKLQKAAEGVGLKLSQYLRVAGLEKAAKGGKL